jgi:hypothetical protein
VAHSIRQEGMNFRELPAFSLPLSEADTLVVGIGGGADIVSAFAIASLFSSMPIYGNTKTRTESDWDFLSPRVARLPASNPTTRGSSGGTSIDRLLPKGPRDCPLIFLCIKRELEALTQEIKAMNFSQIIAVDTGGDVLSNKIGRDQMMLSALRSVGVPLWLLVLAPGADGQSNQAKMSGDLQRAIMGESFRGIFSLSPLLPIYQRFAPHLGETRTPQLILRAHESNEDAMLIPRGCRPTIPIEWMRLGLAFAPKRKI